MLGLGLDIPTIALRNELIEGVTIPYTTEGSLDYSNEAGTLYTNESSVGLITEGAVIYTNENSTQTYTTEG